MRFYITFDRILGKKTCSGWTRAKIKRGEIKIRIGTSQVRRRRILRVGAWIRKTR
jgi:hypothetical protein